MRLRPRAMSRPSREFARHAVVAVLLCVLAALVSGCATGSAASGCGLCSPTLVSPDGAGVVVAQGRTLWRFDASGDATGPIGLLPERRSFDPSALAVDGGVAWVGTGRRTIRVAPDGSLTRTSRRPAAYVAEMIATDGGVWLAAGRRVLRLDAAGEVAARSPRLPAGAWAMTRDATAVFVTGGPLRVVRGRWRPAGPGYMIALDPRTLRRLGPPIATMPWPRAAAVADGAVWLAGDGGRLQRITRDGRRTTVVAPGAEFLAAGDGALWSLTTEGLLQRRDPRTGLPDGAALDLGADTSSLAVAPGSVWVGLHDGGVTRIDPARGAVVWTRDVPVT